MLNQLTTQFCFSRTLLLLHPEMKPLLTPHSTPTNSTSSSTSLCLPLVPQLTDLGLHLACLQVPSSFISS